MRISIREQLGLLVLFCSSLALMVLALATWFQNKSFVTSIRLSGLSLGASLKSAQVSSTLLLYDSQVKAITTRILIQSALQRYSLGNDTNDNWYPVQSDLESALGNGNLLNQAIVYPPNDTENLSDANGLVNVTSSYILDTIPLPYTNENGTQVYLGDVGYGYPPTLYPNLTYVTNPVGGATTVSYDGFILDPRNVLFLGPLVLNETFALMSATTGIINSTDPTDVLGWLTTVVDASLIFDIRNAMEGLGTSGEILIVGPASNANLFQPEIRTNATVDTVENRPVRFVLPPSSNSSIARRHSQRDSPTNSSTSFPMSAYPAVEDAWTQNNNAINNAAAIITTHNEQNVRCSVGYAQVATTMVDWVLLVEQDHSEVVAPINHLRDVVLICVFCTMAGLLLFSFPLAHYSVAPIRQLKTATMKTVEPYQPDDGASGFTQSSTLLPPEDDTEEARKEGFLGLIGLRANYNEQGKMTLPRRRRRTFRIPSKVPERKHWITDELTELTSTFNEMSDELAMQYERLEERVKERTVELEKSKLDAEAANRSKTLFIANISHELKTPLNGILGLTTVCMNEDDPSKIRSTLNTIYKSGDLLLNLLTDLLTFSKNEVGQQMSIDEAEFRISDLSTQLVPTFEKQAREGKIDLKVLFIGTNDAFGSVSETASDNAYGPVGTGRVKDMCLWGDKNRILQVLMNFVSNGLKFTPPQGSVTVRVKCMGLIEEKPQKPESARKSSMRSQTSKSSNKKKVRTSETSLDTPSEGRPQRPPFLDEPKLSITVAGGTTHIAKVVERERSQSPPPLNTKDLEFVFEVEDTGPGIPDDQQKKIFEPFVQGDLGLSKKYGGTGLGLSICAQLAALMGGSIKLESKVGEGSKFIMRLPLRYTTERPASMASTRPSLSRSSIGGAEADSENTTPKSDTTGKGDIPRIVGFTQPYVAKETKPEPPSVKLDAMKKAETEAAKDGRKVRVLVAEDNKINQEVVLRMLKLEDIYDVTIAKDGQEAFEKVKESMQSGPRFHLIFMDVQMPNVDGIQSTKLIRSMGFSAPIVALTAFAEKSNEDECMASGMDYFLAKPIKRPALKHVLKKYCTTIAEEDGENSPKIIQQKPGIDEVLNHEPKPVTNGTSGHELDSTNVSPMS